MQPPFLLPMVRGASIISYGNVSFQEVVSKPCREQSGGSFSYSLMASLGLNCGETLSEQHSLYRPHSKLRIDPNEQSNVKKMNKAMFVWDASHATAKDPTSVYEKHSRGFSKTEFNVAYLQGWLLMSLVLIATVDSSFRIRYRRIFCRCICPSWSHGSRHGWNGRRRDRIWCSNCGTQSRCVGRSTRVVGHFGHRHRTDGGLQLLFLVLLGFSFTSAKIR